MKSGLMLNGSQIQIAYFNVSLNLLVINERGMLAKLHLYIADSEANIDNISVDEGDGSTFSNLRL